MAATVDTRELIALERRFGNVPAAVARDAAHRMTAVVNRGVATAQRGTPVDTRRAQSSITGRVRIAGNEIVGEWGSNLSYFPVIERGRRAGSAMPPKGALLGWLLRHGIPASAEYPIRRAIGRRGLPAHKPLARSAVATRRFATQQFRGLSATVRLHLHGVAA